jgi:hypothetical protein
MKEHVKGVLLYTMIKSEKMVKVSTTKEGYYYEANGKRLGPYSIKNRDAADFRDKLTVELGITLKV